MKERILLLLKTIGTKCVEKKLISILVASCITITTIAVPYLINQYNTSETPSKIVKEDDIDEEILHAKDENDTQLDENGGNIASDENNEDTSSIDNGIKFPSIINVENTTTVEIDENKNLIEKLAYKNEGDNESASLTSSRKNNTYSVSFYDGSRLIDTLITEKGTPLSEVPTTEKTSKKNAIFLGWFTDQKLQEPFYAENNVTSNMSVYGKYQYLGNKETLTPASFAQMDLETNATFSVKGSNLRLEDVMLVPKDGSDVIPLVITGSGNMYTVRAEGGFNEGSSYELTLADGFNFIGDNGELHDSIRTASFSIKMDEVENIKMSNEIAYIKRDASGFEKNDTFEYDDANELEVGQLLGFYKDTKPTERDYINNEYNNDPEIYFKVDNINGNTVTLADMEDEDMDKMYDVPDNFPIETSTAQGSIDISDLDEDIYALMMSADGVTPENALDKAKVKINVGDFITLYDDADNATPDNTVFGEITEYDSVSGTIEYSVVTAQDIEDAMNLYVAPTVDGEDLIANEEVAAIEQTILEQVEASDFAEDAAFLLADMATKTNGFQNIEGVDILFKDEDGNILSDEEIALMNIGQSFELADDILLTVEIINEGDQLHFDDGLQLAIGVDATFEVAVVGGNIVIDMSAVFVEELELGLNVSGDLVQKEVLDFIPVPIGVKVGANVDIKNYTAVSFNVNAYTVAAEDAALWTQFASASRSTKKLVAAVPGMPANLKKGLNKVSDVFNKIDKTQVKIDQAKESAEIILGYAEDIDNLWKLIEANVEGELTTREDFENAAEKLEKTSITKELMDMMNMTTDTELGIKKYENGLNDLMQEYSEMIQTETDWVEIVNQKIFRFEKCVYGIAIHASTYFVVGVDLNIVMGTSLEYEVGKRYSFWFKVGLFKPSAGSETLDLVDEKFAFQFYVMGKLGLRMGVRLDIKVGIGHTDFCSVGLYGELGPYVRLYGFFIYEYEKLRPMNTTDWIYDERMAGALLLEIGVYYKFGFEANALGELFTYSYDFLDEELPLLQIGERIYPYKFNYKPQEDEQVRIVDENADSTDGITMGLPDHYRAINHVELDTGMFGSGIYDYDMYNVTLSNENFSIDDNGVISVSVPKGVQYMECDLTFTYLHGKMAFNDCDMAVTIPLVWTNLSDTELNEYFTASVRVGNATDGYQTVWSEKVLKNEEITLPTADEIKEIIGFNELKYLGNVKYEESGNNVTLIQDVSYDMDVDYREYELTVSGVQNKEGNKAEKTIRAKYGEAFDFDTLKNTGTEIAGKTYTKFANVTTDATIDIGNNQTEVIDLTKPLTSKVIAKLDSMDAKANYEDNSATAVFEFNGMIYDVNKDGTPDSVSQIIERGTEPDLAEIEEIVTYEGLAIADVSPALSKIFASTTYIVTVGELTGDDTTITFVDNDNNDETNIEPITKVEGSLIGNLIEPTRDGYTFGGWFTDDGIFTDEFEERFMDNYTVYAKWTKNEYTVTFNVNGGNGLEEDEATKNVIYSEEYGELPMPTRSGYGFVGWHTAQDGVDDVDSEYTVCNDTIVIETNDHSLYAQWVELKDIPESTFDFGDMDTFNYAIETGRKANYTFSAGEETYLEDEFTFAYKRQGDANYLPDNQLPINAGVYDVKITRDADNVYEKFENTVTGVVEIEKITRVITEGTTVTADVKFNHFSVSKLPANSYPGDGVVEYSLDGTNWQSERAFINLADNTNYTVQVRVAEGKNYLVTPAITNACNVTTRERTKHDWGYKMGVRTADEAYAGTNANIHAMIKPFGENEVWEHIKEKGINDFERGDYQPYTLEKYNMYMYDPWMIEKIGIKLEGGSGVSWHWKCESIDIWYYNEQATGNFKVSPSIKINKEFDKNGENVIKDGNLKREIQSIDYDFESETIVLDAAGNILEGKAFNGLIRDDLYELIGNEYYDRNGDRFDDGNWGAISLPRYNAYSRQDAPVLKAVVSDAKYAQYVDTTLDNYYIDQAGLYEAMQVYGDEEITVTISIEFPNRSTIENDTIKQTKTITLKTQ